MKAFNQTCESGKMQDGRGPRRSCMLKRAVFYISVLLIVTLAFPVLGVASSPSVNACEGVHVDVSEMENVGDASVYIASAEEVLPGLNAVVGNSDFVLNAFSLQIIRPKNDDVDFVLDDFGSLKVYFALPSDYSRAKIYYCDASGCKGTDWLNKDDEGYISINLSSLKSTGLHANLLLAVDGAERNLILKKNSAMEDLNAYLTLFNKSDYSESDWDWIEVYAASGEKSIRIAASADAVDGALALAKTNISAVPKSDNASSGPASAGSGDGSSNSSGGVVDSTKSKDSDTAKSKVSSSISDSTSTSAPLPSATQYPISQGASFGGSDAIEMGEESMDDVEASEEDPLAQASVDGADVTVYDENPAQDDEPQNPWNLDFLTDWRFLSVLLGLLAAFLLTECVIYLVQRHRFVSRHKGIHSQSVASESPKQGASDYKMGSLAMLVSK